MLHWRVLYGSFARCLLVSALVCSFYPEQAELMEQLYALWLVFLAKADELPGMADSPSRRIRIFGLLDLTYAQLSAAVLEAHILPCSRILRGLLEV
jgi:hypothetical protein